MAEDQNSIVFEADLVGKGAPQRLSISIRIPYAKKTGEWACPVSVKGIKQDVASQECLGIDGLQSLVLGLFFVRHTVSSLRKKGYRFADPETGEPIDPEMYFDILTQRA